MKTTQYNGPLQSKKQAADWAKAIRAKYPQSSKNYDAALLLERNWRMVAARPALAAEIQALIN